MNRIFKLPPHAPDLLLIVLLLLALPGTALAQGGSITPIRYGDTVTGTINNTTFEQVYSFEGQAGDEVTIALNRTENTLDPYLVLYDQFPSQNPIAADDDGGGERDSLISQFALPATGTYFIVATRFGRETGTSAGGFTLSLSAAGGSAAAPTTAAATPAATATSGGGISGFGGLPIGGNNQGNQGGVTLGRPTATPSSGGVAVATATPNTAAPTTAPPPTAAPVAEPGLAFQCELQNGSVVEVAAATRVTFRDVRPGFTYRVTVLGLDSFDPVIGLESEGGDRLCNDDEPRAGGSQVAVPGVGLVEASNLTSQLQFTTSGAVGDISMLIGGFGGQGGRYAAVFEGLAINPATEQDAVTIGISQSVIGEELYVYMVSQTNALDSYMFLENSDFVCDDAGVPPCDNIPAFPQGGVSIANGSTYIAGQFDAGIGIIPQDTGDRTFVFQSYQGRTAGNYAMIVIGTVPAPGSSSAGTQSSGSSGGTTPDGIPIIAYGDVVRNSIDNTNWAWVYAFEGQAGDAVTIRHERPQGSTLDPYLFLFDAQENILAQDDDSAGDLGSMIAYTLPSAGTYIIGATRFGLEEGSSSGDFVLSLGLAGGASSGGPGVGLPGASPTAPGIPVTPTVAAPPVSGPPTSATPISYGQSVSGVLDNSSWAQLYTFEGKAGDAVVITLDASAGSGLDPYLGLLDASTVVLDEDDDGNGNLNSRIALTLPADGVYTIFATRFNGQNGTSSGGFTLTLSLGG